MNILTISPLYNPSHGAGITGVIKNTCERLVKRGHHCRVLTINHDNSSDIDELIEGVEVKIIGSRWSKHLYGLSPAMYRYIKKSSPSWLKPDDIDIIHIHMYHNLLALQLIRQLRHCGKPIIFTPHYNAVGHNQLARLLLKLYQPLGKHIFKYVDKVVSVSEYEAALIQRDFFIPEESIKLIHHGVDISEIKPQKKQASNNLRISLLFVGRLEQFKGVQYILKAMKLLKDDYKMKPILNIVGDGPYKKHLKKLTDELGLEHIIWNGVLKHKAVWNKYKNADVFLLPSRTECYGLVVAEALASGVPAIVCDTSALTEFVKEAGCFGIKYPPQPDELARLIVKIHTSEVQVGPFKSAKIRTWDKVVDEYEQLYREFC